MEQSENKTPTTFNNLITLSNYFRDENLCRKYLEKFLWNGKPVCPKCAGEKIYSFPDGKRYKCANNKCYKIFTVTEGTHFESSKIPLSKWLHAIYVFTSHKKGISSHQLAKDISVTQKTAWFLLSRIREILREKAPVMLEGIVEVDETFVGGLEGNKHQSYKAKKKRAGKKKNGNGDDKTIVIGLVQRGGKVVNQVVNSTQKKDLLPVIEKHIKKGSTMVTDEWKSYQSLHRHGYNHESVKHRMKEYVRDEFHTSNIDNYWSHLKRGLIGVYHHASPQHLHRYCNEFSFRYNTRKLNEVDRFDLAIKQAFGRLKYDDLINPQKPIN